MWSWRALAPSCGGCCDAENNTLFIRWGATCTDSRTSWKRTHTADSTARSAATTTEKNTEASLKNTDLDRTSMPPERRHLGAIGAPKVNGAVFTTRHDVARVRGKGRLKHCLARILALREDLQHVPFKRIQQKQCVARCRQQQQVSVRRKLQDSSEQPTARSIAPTLMVPQSNATSYCTVNVTKEPLSKERLSKSFTWLFAVPTAKIRP